MLIAQPKKAYIQNYCAPSRAKFGKCEILSVSSPIVACYLSLVTDLHIMALDRFVLPIFAPIAGQIVKC